MKKVLVAGATGYLGQFVVKALKTRGYWVRAVGRSAAKLAPIEEYSVMTMDVIGKPHGQRRLAEHFRNCSETIGSKSSEDHPLPV
ncbi:MAG: NmrA family NAD(P)-binding protein [Gammaproteobacteria bacterium]|nr:NmrA family NAD(P)-binding protein [Gammaproteobacteria bacterium]